MRQILQAIGPTGKRKNCNEWAEYEAQSSRSPTSAMCNGGRFEGHNYPECPSKHDCRAATFEKDDRRRHQQQQRQQQRNQLPVLNAPRPFTKQVVGTPGLAPWNRERTPITSIPTKKHPPEEQSSFY